MNLQLENWWLVVVLFILMIPQLISIAKIVVTRYGPQT